MDDRIRQQAAISDAGDAGRIVRRKRVSRPPGIGDDPVADLDIGVAGGGLLIRAASRTGAKPPQSGLPVYSRHDRSVKAADQQLLHAHNARSDRTLPAASASLTPSTGARKMPASDSIRIPMTCLSPIGLRLAIRVDPLTAGVPSQGAHADRPGTCDFAAPALYASKQPDLLNSCRRRAVCRSDQASMPRDCVYTDQPRAHAKGAASMAMWYYAQHGQRRGPVSSSDLKNLAQSGALAPTDLVWREGGQSRMGLTNTNRRQI